MNVGGLRSTLDMGTLAGAASQKEAKVSAGGSIDPTNESAISGSADVYHGSNDPASANLLAQSGVNAYTTLTNLSPIIEKYDKAVNLLTVAMPTASARLQSAYHAAVSKLSTQLQQKDWGFSVSNGNLVFTQGKDKLSAQDVTALQRAFAGSNVASAADQVATTVVTSIELKRESGSASGNLGWGRFEVDKTNFSTIVDLRSFVTSIMPGGKYNMNANDPTSYGQVHGVLAPIAMLDLIAANAKSLPGS
jgi:hypothetical protein